MKLPDILQSIWPHEVHVFHQHQQPWLQLFLRTWIAKPLKDKIVVAYSLMLT